MITKEQRLIDQIHNEFDTAQDRLLSQAIAVLNKQLPDVDGQKQSIALRLQRAGFTAAPLLSEFEQTLAARNKEKELQALNLKEAELIKYYKDTYPFLKFLTEPELDRICTKYNLHYAPVQRYIKNVPEKNLSDIEKAQPLSDGKTYLSTTQLLPSRMDDRPSNEYYVNVTRFYGGEEDQKIEKFLKGRSIKITPHHIYSDGTPSVDNFDIRNGLVVMGYKDETKNWTPRDYNHSTFRKDGLFIAAPKNHFDKKGLTKTGLGFFEIFKTEVKDPIVFRYVRGGIQVITKWGLEANDPALVVPVLN